MAYVSLNWFAKIEWESVIQYTDIQIMFLCLIVSLTWFSKLNVFLQHDFLLEKLSHEAPIFIVMEGKMVISVEDYLAAYILLYFQCWLVAGCMVFSIAQED